MGYKRKRLTPKRYGGKNRKFSFRKGRPTWGSMYKATKKSTWKSNRKRKSQGSQLGGYSSTVVAKKAKYNLAYKIGKAIVAPTMVNSTFSFRHDNSSNIQNSYSQGFLNGVPTTSNGMDLNQMFLKTGLNAPYEQMFLDSASIRMNITNISNVIMNICIRDIVAKIDMNTGETFSNPITCWTNTSAEISGSGSFTNTTIGASPVYETSDWTKYFRVEKTSKIRLNPGQVHIHDYKCKLNKKISYSEIHNGGAGGDLQNVRNITRYVMITSYGSPAVSDLNPSYVGITPGSIAVTGDYHAQFHFIKDTSKLVYKLPNLVNPMQTITDFVTVNDDDGGIQPFGVA